MTPLIVVTGVPASGKTGLATALAERLGYALVSLDEIKEELAVEAEDTPREWLRYDAEAELLRRLEAFGGEAVVDIWIAPRRDTSGPSAAQLAAFYTTVVWSSGDLDRATIHDGVDPQESANDLALLQGFQPLQERSA